MHKTTMTRSMAVSHFNEMFTAGEEGAFFYGKNAFFFSGDVIGMVETVGKPLRTVLLTETYGETRWAPEFTGKVVDAEKMFKKKYAHFFRIATKPICRMLDPYSAKELRRIYMVFSYKDGKMTISMHSISKMRAMLRVKVSQSVGESPVPDFIFNINGMVMRKIICQGFAGYATICVRYTPGEKVVFFNRHKTHDRRYWAVKPGVNRISYDV